MKLVLCAFYYIVETLLHKPWLSFKKKFQELTACENELLYCKGDVVQNKQSLQFSQLFQVFSLHLTKKMVCMSACKSFIVICSDIITCISCKVLTC